MKLWSKDVLKGFAAVAMLCIVGAVFATPVALGDAAAVGYEIATHKGSWDTAHSLAAMEGIYSCTELALITAAVVSTGGVAAIPLLAGTAIC